METVPSKTSTNGPSQRGSESGGFDWARARDIVLTLVGGAVLLYLLVTVLHHVIRIILIFVLAAIVSFLLEPLVGRLERRGIGRGWATGVAYVVFLLALIASLYWIGGGLVNQFTQLGQQIPSYARTLQQERIPAAQAWLVSHGVPVDLSQVQRDAGTSLQSVGGYIVSHGLDVVTLVADLVADFVLIVVISLYLVLDGHQIRDALAALIPPERQRLFLFLETSLVRVLGGYIRGQLVMAAIIGLSAAVGCWLLGVHYPLVIGVLAFFFELIPMIGPVLAAIPAIVVSAFQPWPLVLLVVGFFIVMQLVESNVLGPRITGHAVGLHPIASILALIGGAEVAGIWGALFAVPIVGLTAVLAMAAFNELHGRSPEEVIRPRKPWRLPKQ